MDEAQTSEGTENVVVDTVTPSEETTPEIAPAEPTVTQVADRSEYNCSACKGEGLKSDTELCPDCFGTGKV